MIRLFTTHDGVVLYVLLLLLLLFYSFPFPYWLFHSTNIFFRLQSDFIDIDEWRTSKDVDTSSQIEYASIRLADVSVRMVPYSVFVLVNLPFPYPAVSLPYLR